MIEPLILLDEADKRLIFRMMWQRGFMVWKEVGETPHRALIGVWPNGEEMCLVSEFGDSPELYFQRCTAYRGWSKALEDRLYRWMISDI